MAILQELSDKVLAAAKRAFVGKKPEGPKYDDLAAIRDKVAKRIEQVSHQRWVFERQWFRNVLYYAGNQWLTWDRNGRRWRERRLRKWVPKPVTNRFASSMDTITSVIQGTEAHLSYWPSTDNADDLATATVAEKVQPIIDDDVDIAQCRKFLARWVTLCGDSFALLSYDFSLAYGFETQPSWQCQACGTVSTAKEIVDAGQKCPKCGSPLLAPAVDEQGQPVTTKIPKGKLVAEILSPFDVYLDPEIEDVRKHNAIVVVQSLPLEEIKARWPETSAGVDADLAGFEKTGEHYRAALAFISDATAYTSGRGIDKTQRATVQRLFELPTDEFPDGLYVALANQTILEAGPLPTWYTKADGTRTPYIAIVHFGYNKIPGRLWHKTPANDLIPKQDQRNRLESLLELMTMRGAYNTWLLPHGSSVANLSGEPGQRVTWSPAGTGGAKPELITGQGPNPGVLAWLDKIDADFEELGGTFDVLKGTVPRGVSAGYAIQLLTDRGFSRFGTVFENWAASWTRFYETALCLFREHAVVDRLRAIVGDTGEWEVEKFSAADLPGSVDIRPEMGQSKPKSQLAVQASIEQLIKLGVVSSADPEQRYKIASEFGLSHLLGGVDDDMREAAREFDLFATSAAQATDPATLQELQAPKVSAIFDDHNAHVISHRKSAKTDRYRQLSSEMQAVWERHTTQHLQALQPQPPPPRPAPQQPEGLSPSKARETSDHTMDVMRRGGSAVYGAPGGPKNATQP